MFKAKARQLLVCIILLYKGRGRREARARLSTAASLGCGHAPPVAEELETASGPLLWHGSPVEQHIGEQKRPHTTFKCMREVCAAPAAGCTPRPSTKGRRAARIAPSPSCLRVSSLGLKGRLAYALCWGKSGGIAAGASTKHPNPKSEDELVDRLVLMLPWRLLRR